jgi:alanine transaminase
LLLERDGHPADPESIFLTAGASGGVSSILSVALRPGDGCMIPIPQYPLYTATLAYLNAKPIPYYLQETAHWPMAHSDLVDAIAKAREANTPIKALVIINPGNPTGACLPIEAMREVIQLCYDESLVLLADEVYQANIFDHEKKPFISFKKALREMPKEVAEGVELVSFHSISKGVSGECGRRGGYYEVVNMREDVLDQVYKMASVNLCPPITGQVSVVVVDRLPCVYMWPCSAFLWPALPTSARWRTRLPLHVSGIYRALLPLVSSTQPLAARSIKFLPLLQVPPTPSQR